MAGAVCLHISLMPAYCSAILFRRSFRVAWELAATRRTSWTRGQGHAQAWTSHSYGWNYLPSQQPSMAPCWLRYVGLGLSYLASCQISGTVPPSLVGTVPLPDGKSGFGRTAAHDDFRGFSPVLCPRRSSGKTSDGLRCKRHDGCEFGNSMSTRRQLRPPLPSRVYDQPDDGPDRSTCSRPGLRDGDGTIRAYDAGSYKYGNLIALTNPSHTRNSTQ